MKKFIIAIIAALFLISSTVFAEKISSEAQFQELNGASVKIAVMPDDSQYITDLDGNIIHGPYSLIADFGGFPYVQNEDGSTELFDIDGTPIVKAPPELDINPPENGIYSVSTRIEADEDFEKDNYRMTIYDYETRQEIAVLNRPVFYWLEQQTDKMVTKKNGKYAFINKYGELQSDYVYDEIKKRFNPDYEPYPKSYAIVIQDGVEKYIDWDLNEIDLNNYNGEPFITNCSCPTDENWEKNENYYIMESGDRTGLYDIEQEKYAIPLQNEFKICSVYDKSYVYVIKDNETGHGILDMNGNTVIPPEYRYIEYLGGSCFKYEKIIGTDENGIYQTEHGIIKDGRNIFSSDKYIFDILGDGLIALHYPDPNESFEYAHNYRDYIYEIVNYAGHSMTGDTYTSFDYRDGILYTSHAYHSSDPPTDITNISKDFAVINLNGKYLDFDGVIRDDRTLVPIREIVEGLGGTVTWNDDEQSVHTVIDGKTIDLIINSAVMTVDGVNNELDVPAQIINDKTMLPLRAVAEAVGAVVDWDESIKCVYITKNA